MSFGTLCLLVLVSSVAFLSFKLAPLYIDNAYVKSGLKSVLRHPDGVANLSDHDVRLLLEKQLLVNGVSADFLETLKVFHDGDEVVIAVWYEQRVPLAFNVDVLLSFKNMIDSRYPEDCCRWKDIGDEDMASRSR